MVQGGGKWAKGFNPSIQSATEILKNADGKVTGWTLEAAIPFKDLDVAERRAPAEGEVWLFNVFRVAMKAEGQAELSMWQRVHPEFHRPHQFPKLLFTGP